MLLVDKDRLYWVDGRYKYKSSKVVSHKLGVYVIHGGTEDLDTILNDAHDNDRAPLPLEDVSIIFLPKKGDAHLLTCKIDYDHDISTYHSKLLVGPTLIDSGGVTKILEYSSVQAVTTKDNKHVKDLVVSKDFDITLLARMLTPLDGWLTEITSDNNVILSSNSTPVTEEDISELRMQSEVTKREARIDFRCNYPNWRDDIFDMSNKYFKDEASMFNFIFGVMDSGKQRSELIGVKKVMFYDRWVGYGLKATIAEYITNPLAIDKMNNWFGIMLREL